MGQHAFEQAFRLMQEMVQDWSGKVALRHGLQEFRVYLTPTDDLRLALIVVPEAERCSGAGSAALRDLCALSDAWGRRILLSPAEAGGAYGTSSRARLERFYARFGFRDADDAARDATVPDAMVREASPAMSNRTVLARSAATKHSRLSYRRKKNSGSLRFVRKEGRRM